MTLPEKLKLKVCIFLMVRIVGISIFFHFQFKSILYNTSLSWLWMSAYICAAVIVWERLLKWCFRDSCLELDILDHSEKQKEKN